MNTTTISNTRPSRPELLACAVLCAIAVSACLKSSVTLGSDTGGAGGNGAGGNGGDGGSFAAPTGDPPGIDRTKTIADLTDAEAQAWCEWFVTSAYDEGGAPPPSDMMVSADGEVWLYAATYCGTPEMPLCIARLSVHHCVANLQLHACTATIGELDDCVHSMVNKCQTVGQGCDAYIAQPSCSQTIVTAVDLPTDGCRLPVQ